jgi:pyruvate dehydrogenase (quinone)/pyruvate oxidase
MEEIGTRRDKPMKPQVVAWELGKRLSSDAIVSADSRLDQALAATGPVIVEAVVDPFTPPAPAKITLQQAAKFAQSLARGEPNRSKIAWTVLSEKVRELV